MTTINRTLGLHLWLSDIEQVYVHEANEIVANTLTLQVNFMSTKNKPAFERCSEANRDTGEGISHTQAKCHILPSAPRQNERSNS